MAVSDDTILRTVKRVDVDPAAVPLRVVGVDDWAWKKGQTCGTILVDLERNGVIDLLPERSSESLAAWLAQHPGIEFISRDRQGLYADGARSGAPQAQQVADRFHLGTMATDTRASTINTKLGAITGSDAQLVSLFLLEEEPQ